MEIKIEVAHRPNRPPGSWSGGDAGSIDRDTSRISNGDELRSLLDWLRREDLLRGRATLSQGPPEPGEMGTGTDVLTIVLGSGGTVALLARALSVWLSHRTSDRAVRITRPDGQQVEIEARRVRDIRAVIEDVQELFDQPGHPGLPELPASTETAGTAERPEGPEPLPSADDPQASGFPDPAPSDIARKINDVTRGGTKCTTFRQCVDLLRQDPNKDIDYDGVSGPLEFTDRGKPSMSSYAIYTVGSNGTAQAGPIHEVRAGRVQADGSLQDISVDGHPVP